jgi:hypothetical protein
LDQGLNRRRVRLCRPPEAFPYNVFFLAPAILMLATHDIGPFALDGFLTSRRSSAGPTWATTTVPAVDPAGDLG